MVSAVHILKAMSGCVEVGSWKIFAMISITGAASTLPIESIEANQASVRVSATRDDATDSRS